MRGEKHTLSDTDPLVGKTIGSYRIIKCLGKGGMGAVYFGEHPQIESKVAIKVLLPRFVSAQDIVRRFFDEARAVNRIGHPGIVRIHDCNRQDDVGVYLVMELLEGESLAERFARRGRLDWEEVARLVQQAASALQASHETGIIHRDLKPANIFVVPDPDMPGGERIKILDFGIAKLLEDNDPLDGHGTKTGMVIGSPMYMSPEQCIDSKAVDHRTDIYSLGAIAYRLMAGEFPYEADTLGRLILKQQKEKPAPLRSLDPDVPRAIADVIHRALETDREDRHADMAIFRSAMRAAVEGDVDEEPGGIEPLDTEPMTLPPEELTGPPIRPAADADSNIGLDETEVAGLDEDSVVGPAKDAGEEKQATTLSGTVGEKTAAPVEEPQGNRGVLVAGGLLLVIAVIVAMVLWSRHGRHMPPDDTVGRTTAAAVPPPSPTPASPAALPAAKEPPQPATGDVKVAVASPPVPGGELDRPEAKAEPGVAPDHPVAAAKPPAKPRSRAKPQRDEMSDEVPQVKVTLKLTPNHAKILLDGKPAGNPLTFPADGKKRMIRVVAEGYWTAWRGITVKTDKTLTFTLRKKGGAGARPTPGEDTAPTKLKKKKLKKKLKKKKRIYFRTL